LQCQHHFGPYHLVRGHKDAIALLLEYGGDVNSQNVDGHTALMFAYNGKNQVETLLDKYKDYMAEASDNSTAIIMEALQLHVDVVNLLLAKGADPNIKVIMQFMIETIFYCNVVVAIL